MKKNKCLYLTTLATPIHRSRAYGHDPAFTVRESAAKWVYPRDTVLYGKAKGPSPCANMNSGRQDDLSR